MATLAIKKIRLDGGTQARVALNPITVDEYVADMKHGDKFPPVDVYYDGQSVWLGDGFHRYAAHVQLGHREIEVNQHQGTLDDAILHAAGANGRNGSRLTNEDKRRSVIMLLCSDRWRPWSDNKIAKHCRVSQPFVSKLRNEASNNDYKMERLAERNGTTYTINTAGIRGGRGNVVIEARDLIRETSLADDRAFVHKLGMVPEDRQAAVAKLILSGDAKTIAQAERRLERLAKAEQWKEAAAGVELSDDDCIVHVGDCRNVLADIPDRSIDLVFTDPPYGIGEKYPGFDDNLTRDELMEIIGGMAKHLPRMLKPNGTAMVMMSSRYAYEVRKVLDGVGLYWQDTIVWGESFGAYNSKSYTDSYRVIHYFTRDPEAFTFNCTDTRAFIPSSRNESGDGRQDRDGKLPGNLWGVWTDREVARVVGTADKRIPNDAAVNQLPEKLVERVVLLHSNAGDVVLDPFHGTGTTARACIPLKRRYIGIEVDPDQAKASRGWIKSALAASATTLTKETSSCEST